MLNYTVNGAKTWYSRSHKSQENQFVSAQSEVNPGAWRVRNLSTYSRNAGMKAFYRQVEPQITGCSGNSSVTMTLEYQ